MRATEILLTERKWGSQRGQSAEEIKERHRKLVYQKYLYLKAKVIEILGNHCVRCNFDDWRSLCVDHVHDNGWAHVSQGGFRKTGVNVLYEVIGDPKAKENYQMLCANCNQIKEMERRGYLNKSKIERTEVR